MTLASNSITTSAPSMVGTISWAPSRPAGENKSGRIPALDFTKGALVLIMVLYHWLNYFIGPQGSIYNYLRFLPPSFIFIAGFLISHVYLSKYELTDPRLPRRLLVRGLKVLAVFTFLNVLIALLIPSSYGGKGLVDRGLGDTLLSIYVTGIFANGRAAAFYVLVPISYLLILSALFLIPYRSYRYTFHVLSLLGLISIGLLDSQGIKSGTLELITIGLLGISAGYIPIRKINSVIQHPYLLLAGYAGYIALITFWNVSYLVQLIGVCLTLMVIYLAGSRSVGLGRLQRSLILLGNYSLFGYIAQIAILQVLRSSLRPVAPGVLKLAVSFLAGVVLTYLAVVVADRARKSVPLVNKIYSAVFA